MHRRYGSFPRGLESRKYNTLGSHPQERELTNNRPGNVKCSDLPHVRGRLRAVAAGALLGVSLLATGLGVSNGAQGEVTGVSTPGAESTDGTSSGVPELATGAAVDIQAALGFSGAYRLGTWAPLTVTLENRRANVSGHLEVRVPDGDSLGGLAFTNIHRRTIDLPGTSRKRFHFTIYLKSFSEPVEIRVVAGTRELARKTVDLRAGVTNARMILVLGRDADLDYLNDDRGRRLRGAVPADGAAPGTLGGGTTG